MRPPILRTLLAVSIFALVACSHPNVKSAKDYRAPPAPAVRNPLYNPYAGYGETDAIWRPPAFNTDGTIVKPDEPASQADRPHYERAPWATGADGGRPDAPPGTF